MLKSSSLNIKPPTPKFGEEKVNLAKFKFIYKNKEEKLSYIMSLESAMGLLIEHNLSSENYNLETV